MHTYKPFVAGATGHASSLTIQPGLSHATTGNYDFANSSIGKNSIDSLN